MLGAARGVPYIGALASALYIPSAGEGSARVPGRDEFWYEEVLRQKALAGSTATTRVRFFWRDDIHGKPQVYGVHTGKARRMKTYAWLTCCSTNIGNAMNLRQRMALMGR